MTCAHVVNVALTKVVGIDTVEVSLTRALATVKLKPGNSVSLAQLVRLVREKGYTIPAASIVVSGLPAKNSDLWMLRVPTSGERIELVADPQLSSALARYADRTVTVRGKMTLAKNGKPAPLAVSAVEQLRFFC
jgi:copper chaperone CopZ